MEEENSENRFLSEILDRISLDNTHGEISFGELIGGEVW